MTTIDIGILVFCVFMAAVGWRQGLIVGALSLVGFAAGAYAGTRLAAAIVHGGSSSPYAPLFGLLGALFVGGLLSAGLEVLGIGLRRRLSAVPSLTFFDGILGAALSTALGLAICWVIGAVALQTPGARQYRADIQRSKVLQRLNDILPPSGGLLNAIARFDPFPTLNGPSAQVAAPPRGVGRDPHIRRVAGSVVRVTGTACGLGIEGSGWVAGPGLVVTNAHVVAGEDDTGVQVEGSGTRLPAKAVAFDPKNDIAVLRVGGLTAPALTLAHDPPVGRIGAVLGFPRNGPYDVRDARLGPTRSVISSDAYGNPGVRRSIVVFRALVRPGNSGGPVVDTRSRVIATVFATASDRGRRHTGYGVPNAVVRKHLSGLGGRVSTGPCAP
ncbi:MarP family serine protease [Paraconexibacter antarcticus]|uniref:MarP family serine protease n=1 Tax=Paraconexibacter antarcticus TaxID=2949664 RepID=A0ABY5DYD1_9ACTN|nr:MarP family serine protease [Paraconexibacter antarcticus]UTI66574.1 MarP family serine protease [Paraconexibacter antarcticus]